MHSRSDHKMGSIWEIYISAITAIYLLNRGTTVSATDANKFTQVNVHKDEASRLDGMSSSSMNASFVQPFQCNVTGLNETQLANFDNISVNDSTIVIVRRNHSDLKLEEDDVNVEKPVDIQFKIVNNTLIINGHVRVNKKGGDETTMELHKCDIVFKGGNEEIIVLVGKEESPPKILTSHNHVALMNGAPDQVISCTADGQPSPRITWKGKTENLEEIGAVVLFSTSQSDSDSSKRTSYLLFPHVNSNHSGNYTCVAENEFGTATSLIEVEVVSVEAISTKANDVLEDSSELEKASTSNKIFFQHITQILSRSKRHLWYIPPSTFYRPINRPPPPAGADNQIYTHLQKMVNFIAERLKLADKVAVNKWDNELPVEDIPREQIILENMVRQAESRGLDPEWAQRFFRDQIEANKDIQFALIRKWQSQGRRPYGPPVDLANDVRPNIDKINNKLIDLAKITDYERLEWRCKEEVERNARYATFLYNLDPLHQKALQRATSNVCLVPRYRPSLNSFLG